MTAPSPTAVRRVIIGIAAVGLGLVILSHATDLTQSHVPQETSSEKGELLFEDTFDRSSLGDKWKSMHAGWTIVNGWVHSSKAHNRALWLQEEFPGNVIIEFDARSEPPKGDKKFRGDIKVDVFATHPERVSCGRDLCSKGYVVINGGWFNKTDLIARLDEHKTDPSIVTRRSTEAGRSLVKPSVVYQWKIVRRGSIVEWYRNDKLQLTYDDTSPVKGGFFGFNNWESNVFFDNLRVFALSDP